MNNLYTGQNATKFSETRNLPWAGWNRLLALLKLKDKNLNAVLDLGCGNARFLDFLLDSKIDVDSYAGVDNSEELLEIANTKPRAESQKPKSINFVHLDLNDVSWKNEISQKFDLIVAFGLMHHLKDFESRKNLVNSAHSLLQHEGTLVLTFWKFMEDEEFMRKHLVKKLDSKNDFILSFGKDAQRFCHYSDEEEVEKLIDKAKFEIINEFSSDGFGDRMNRYIVLKPRTR